MKNSAGRKIVFAGSILLIISSTSRWINIYQYNKYQDSLIGTSLIEGKVFLFYGIISAILAFVIKGKPGKIYSLPISFIGIFSGYYFMRFANQLTPYIIDSSNGIETIPTLWFYLLFVSSLLISLGGFLKIKRKESDEQNL